MRNRLLAIAAIAGVLGVPLAVQAQTVGIVRGESVIVDDDDDFILPVTKASNSQSNANDNFIKSMLALQQQ